MLQMQLHIPFEQFYTKLQQVGINSPSLCCRDQARLLAIPAR